MAGRKRRQTIQGFDEWAKRVVKGVKEVKKLIPGEIHRIRGVYPFTVEVVRRTETGLKCRAKGSGEVQDCHIVLNNPKKTPDNLSMYVTGLV